MTTTVIQFSDTLMSTSRLPYTTIPAILFVIIGMIILIQKEFIRTLPQEQAQKWMQTIDVVLIPILLFSGVIIGLRIIALIAQ